jgi:hypothetical protein
VKLFDGAGGAVNHFGQFREKLTIRASEVKPASESNPQFF